MRRSRNRLSAPGLLGLAVLLGAAGCSTTDTFEQPRPVPDIEASVELEPVWSMSVGDGHDDEYLYLSPLNTGDVLYAASADGTVYAVGADQGKVVWKKTLKDRIFSGVGGDAERLYLTTQEADLVALSREDGAEAWRVELPTEVLSAPQSNGRMVVAQTTDGRVLAFDAATGDKLWRYDGVVPVLSMRAAAAPLVGGDVVIASFSNGKLIALSADSGQPLWQYAVGEPQGRTELERLVDISGQPIVVDTAIMAVGYQGKLALVDVRTGQEIWNRKASSLYSPTIGGGNIYLASANGNVVALRGSDRRELWTQDRLAWRQLTQPVISGDYLVAGDYEGYLHVFSREDGSLQGQLDFDDDGIRVPAQRLENGNLLIYGNGGRMSVLQIQPSE
ncbi:outer membrane protein assembly factor BamB [Marinobacter salinisoli]|uniref:Outer membrane protein assembly factor BamB n=1 Tax=Marinobacter salinisoli TaxID=2769486 RepID=A0ABX7MPK5_9GAMM|nr:outer membrane protein assembly factor BamB [Marinobacter salinisoli]QSP94084.1 outer membrane protein assembly factor BamB [Marinobacter salinisoli]